MEGATLAQNLPFLQNNRTEKGVKDHQAKGLTSPTHTELSLKNVTSNYP